MTNMERACIGCKVRGRYLQPGGYTYTACNSQGKRISLGAPLEAVLSIEEDTPADAFLFTGEKQTTVFEYEDGSSEWETLKTLRGIDVFTWDPEDLEEYYTLRDELYAQLNIQF